MKTSYFKYLLIVLATLLSSYGRANVFGDDNRDMVSESAFNSKPISMIVKIGVCTGGLVGPNLVLTAYHCIRKKYKDGKITRKITVRAGAYESKSLAKTKVIEVVTGGESGTAKDWAILILDKNLGQSFGYFRVRGFVNFTYEDINLAGYSKDRSNRVLSIHQGCAITKVLTDKFLYNCDSTGGASGSPLWRRNQQGEYEIVGLHFGGRRPQDHRSRSSRFKTDAYSHELANVAVRPHNYADTLLNLL